MKETMHFEGTIFSSPERGKGGKSSYRGNCCPGIIEAFINQYKMKYLSDYAIGGGTTKDVCEKMGVNGVWTDLRLGFDLMTHEIPDCPENIFFHPPYYNMNGKIIYSNTEYDWKEVQQKYGYDPRNTDLSQCKSWEQFVKMMNFTVMKQYAALQKGGRFAILMGDIKTKGRLYSMLFEIVKPGTVEQVVIKTQHNCVSSRTNYSGNFIPTMHEYLLILRKDFPYMLNFQMTKNVKLDVRDSESATWKDVVLAVMEELHQEATLEKIYKQIEGHKKCETNKNWRAKVRQILNQQPSVFFSPQRGVWALVA